MSVVLCECAARDGLQHEPNVVPTQAKIDMVNTFTGMGFTRVEVTSFSHPRYVPQFADAEIVLREVVRRANVSLKAVCVNGTAVRRAIATVDAGYGPDEISVVVSASEAHSRFSTHRTHEAIRSELDQVVPLAQDAGLKVGGTIATAFGCPFTGQIDYAALRTWVQYFVDRGVGFVSLGDTTGMAVPRSVEAVYERLMVEFPQVEFAAHFHDTRGAGILNTFTALRAGVTHVDSAFGGLGGHPAKIKYAEGHTGNVSTEDLVAMLNASGYVTGVDSNELVPVALMVERILGRELYSRVARAGLATDLIPLEKDAR